MFSFSRPTSEAWARFFALSMLLGGFSAVLLGSVTLLFSPFAPAMELGKGFAVLSAIMSGVLSLVLGGLYLLVGAGLWAYRPWSRTVMLVLSWIGAAFVALLLFGTIILTIVSFTDLVSLHPGIAALALLVTIVLCIISAFYIWFFGFEPNAKALYTNTKGNLKPSLKPAMFPSLVQGWAISTWVTAAWLAASGLLLAAAGPALLRWLATIPETEIAPYVDMIVPFVVGIGIIMVLAAVLLHFIAWGLWLFKSWARKTVVVLAWIAGVPFALLIIAMPFVADNAYDGAIAVAQFLYYLLFAGIQVWFFTLPGVIELFTIPLEKVKRRRK